MSAPMRRVLFRRRLLGWRASLSIPTLLSRLDERRVSSLITALNAGLGLLTIGLLAWLADLPMLFPALGPSAFILSNSPFSPSAAPRSVVLGHGIGLIIGATTWHVFSALTGEPISIVTGGFAVFGGATLALAATSILLVRFSCPHAPACATALIVAMGAASRWTDLLCMAVSVVLLTTVTRLLGRIGGLNTPTWYPRESDSPDDERLQCSVIQGPALK